MNVAQLAGDGQAILTYGTRALSSWSMFVSMKRIIRCRGSLQYLLYEQLAPPPPVG